MISFSTMLARSPLSPLLQTMEDVPSRRMVIKGMLAVIASSAPGAALDFDAEARHHRRRRRHKKRKHHNGPTPLSCDGDSCDGTGGKPCGDDDTCQCYRWAKGGNVCASALQSSCEATCQSDRDCPHGHVCVEGGPACCGSGERFCKAACYA
jgi:hypothetical protein